MSFFRTFMVLTVFWSGAVFGHLTVFPEKVVFEPGQRSVKVNLQNRGNETYTYRIGWEDVLMTPEGGVEKIDDKNVLRKTPAASSMIRFAPRQVILNPGETQAVRVMLRRPSDLKSGEYRSHMLFQRLQEVKAIDIKQTEDSMGLTMGLLIGTSIPVFVREGEGSADVMITDASIGEKDGIPHLNIGFKRSGPISSRIQVRVFPQGEEDQPALVSFRALYTDHEDYSLSIPFTDPSLLKGVREFTVEVDYTVTGEDTKKVTTKISI